MTHADSQFQPIAAIDVGTNSFHLIIASVSENGTLKVLGRAKEIVRLGSGGGDMRELSCEAIKRGAATLKRFAVMAEQAGASTRAIATSAVREAENKDEFIEIVEAETGIKIEVVSGTEESRLIYLGAMHALPIFSKRVLMFDIGGGSAEIVLGLHGEILRSHSVKLGAVRLTQRFFSDGKSVARRIAKCREYIRGELSPILHQFSACKFEVAAATSGTAHAIGGMVLAARGQRIPDAINGTQFSQDELLSAVEQIIRAGSPRERAKLPGIDAGRTDIILAGALIFERIIKGLNIRKLTLSAFALREGIVFDTAQQQSDRREFHHLSRLRYETVQNLCEVYRVNMTHAGHIRNLALQIFDDLQSQHLLGDNEREQLEAAAFLHDVGYHISPDQHHKHSYYIILNCVMPGFTNDEAEIIANIARYHRKSPPKKNHENFATLSPAKQRTIKILAGILRIAEGLDRRQKQFVASARVIDEGQSLRIEISQSSNIAPDIELWGAERRKSLLEDTLEYKVMFKVENIAGN